MVIELDEDHLYPSMTLVLISYRIGKLKPHNILANILGNLNIDISSLRSSKITMNKI